MNCKFKGDCRMNQPNYFSDHKFNTKKDVQIFGI